MKTVLITGGSGGIGEAICEEFAKDSDVIFTYNSNEEKALQIAERLNCTAIKCDVSCSFDVKNLYETVKKSFPRIDVLVNNAGISQIKLFSDITDYEWQKMISVNLNSAFYVTKAFLKDMINAKKGSIINISSVWGVHGASCEVHYSTSKAALIGFTKALAKEAGPSGITVNCIAPGVIDTPMNCHLSEDEKAYLTEETPLGRMGKASEVAVLVRNISESSFITGQIIGIDGGFY